MHRASNKCDSRDRQRHTTRDASSESSAHPRQSQGSQQSAGAGDKTIPNVGEHLGALTLPLASKPKVAEFDQRRLIVREEGVVKLQVSVRKHTKRVNTPLAGAKPYPMCVYMLASSLDSQVFAKPKSHSFTIGGFVMSSSVLSSLRSLCQNRN